MKRKMMITIFVFVISLSLNSLILIGNGDDDNGLSMLTLDNNYVNIEEEIDRLANQNRITYFIKNNGQLDNENILYYSNNGNYYFERNGFYLKIFEMYSDEVIQDYHYEKSPVDRNLGFHLLL